ncbi:MAG: hypothetical protein KDA88_11265 [Planctomycetaceae bacterium]|nr:hypothetical protein [Planctomycetaceae bacterium]
MDESFSRWHHNLGVWLLAVVAVGGLVGAVWPEKLTVVSHGTAIHEGRPVSVMRVDGEKLAEPTPADSVVQPQRQESTADEAPAVIALPSTCVEPQALWVDSDEAFHSRSLTNHPAAILTLPDRVDPSDIAAGVVGVAFTKQTATENTSKPDDSVSPPQIIAQQRREDSSTVPAVRLSGVIVPVTD